MPPENTEQRKLAAIMFTDMVGYSALSQRDDKLALELLEEHRHLLREIFPRFHGTEIKTIGDAFLLEFSSALEAAQCAIEIQRTLAKRNHDVPTGRRIEVRIGIHIGDVVHRGGDVYGDGVNIASRIEPLAGAGGICVSMDVERQIRNALEARLEKLAPSDLKNISVAMDLFRIVLPWETKAEGRRPNAEGGGGRSPRPSRKFGWIAALVLLVVGFGWWWVHQSNKTAKQGASAQTSAADQKSIAVLPFENRSEDKANAYFADGIQDEILTRLSKIADLKVISRTSTQHYKSAPENLPEIARQLGVAHIVEGSVQKSGDTVRINVQLIRAADDSHLWADSFDRKLTDIFSVETEVAKAIADHLQAKLTGREKQEIAAKPTDNSEAYDAYLRGVDYNSRSDLSPENSIQAQKYLRQAVRLDPKFALAWALLSQVDAGGYITTFLQPTEALRDETLRAAETALALNPDLGEALLAKALYHYACFKDYDTAERYLEQARQLLPNSRRVPEILAFVARRRGEWDKSEKYFIEAERLDPRNPGLLAQHAFSYIHLRQFPEALRKLDAILDITPDDLDAVAAKGGIAQVEGDLPRASALLAPLHPPPTKTLALQRQIYQAILERSPSSIILRLKEILANPDPAMGYFNGELRFWLGWAQQIAGEHAAAQESWKQARTELEGFLKEQPDNQFLMGDLALVYVGLGEKVAAFAMVDRSLAFPSFQKDALAAARSLEMLARVAAGTGEADRALPAIEKLLATPLSGQIARAMPLTPALLRLDPMFDPLRNDPRFQELCEDKPK